jgi:Glycosyl transferases group 1
MKKIVVFSVSNSVGLRQMGLMMKRREPEHTILIGNVSASGNRLGATFFFKKILDLSKILFFKKHGIGDVVVVSPNLVSFVVIPVLALLAGKKSFFIIHSLNGNFRRPLYDCIKSILWRFPSGILVHRKFDAAKFLSLGIRSSVVTCPDYGDYIVGSESETISAIGQEFVSFVEQQHTKGCRVGLFFGLVRQSKRPDIALHIASMASVSVAIIGKQIDVKLPCPVSERILVSDNFVPEGDVAAMFRKCDFVILPYDTISESGVLQIANKFGKPTICSDAAGFQEGQTGCNSQMFPVGNFDAAAKATQKLLNEIDKDAVSNDDNKLVTHPTLLRSAIQHCERSI